MGTNECIQKRCRDTTQSLKRARRGNLLNKHQAYKGTYLFSLEQSKETASILYMSHASRLGFKK